MRILALSLLSSLALCSATTAQVDYEFAPNWLTPAPGSETIGNGHGEIRVDSEGKIYVSVEGAKEGGLQVYSPEGKFLNYVAGTPGTLHGFVIKKEADGEFIYAAVLGQQRVLKMKLDGTVVLEIPTASFPSAQAKAVSIELKDKSKLSGEVSTETATDVTIKKADGTTQTVNKDQIAKRGGGLKLTSCDVAPNGDIYVVDGYGQDWIFVFDKEGKFKKVFGGRGEPLKLSNCHKIFIDPRFEPARLFLCDRGNNRLIHLDLDGNLIGVIVDKDLRRPSSASFHGDLVCIAEIAGRVSVWNKEGKQVADLGVNDTPGQTNTPGVAPADWRTGTVTSPHGITFDAKGNILETEWNKFGRVLRWNRQ